MRKSLLAGSALLVGVVIGVSARDAASQAPTIKRTPLGKMDVPGSAYEVVVAKTELPAGFKPGRHFHPGSVTTYILEGELMLALDGQPVKTFKAGETLQVLDRVIHDEGAVGDKPVKMIAVYMVEKGKPMAESVK